MRVRDRRTRRDRGAAAVEFALIAPILFLLVFAIISFGFMLSFRQTLSQAATEGARAAAVQTDDSQRVADASSAVSDAMSAVGVECAGGQLLRNGEAAGTCDVQAATACANEPTQQCLTVELTYAYADHPMVPSLLVGGLMPDEMSYAATVRVS